MEPNVGVQKVTELHHEMHMRFYLFQTAVRKDALAGLPLTLMVKSNNRFSARAKVSRWMKENGWELIAIRSEERLTKEQMLSDPPLRELMFSTLQRGVAGEAGDSALFPPIPW